MYYHIKFSIKYIHNSISALTSVNLLHPYIFIIIVLLKKYYILVTEGTVDFLMKIKKL